MKAFYTDHFVLPLPSGHRFPMEKYRKLRNLVGELESIELVEAPAATDTQILYAHDPCAQPVRHPRFRLQISLAYQAV